MCRTAVQTSYSTLSSCYRYFYLSFFSCPLTHYLLRFLSSIVLSFSVLWHITSFDSFLLFFFLFLASDTLPASIPLFCLSFFLFLSSDTLPPLIPLSSIFLSFPVLWHITSFDSFLLSFFLCLASDTLPRSIPLFCLSFFLFLSSDTLPPSIPFFFLSFFSWPLIHYLLWFLSSIILSFPVLWYITSFNSFLLSFFVSLASDNYLPWFISSIILSFPGPRLWYSARASDSFCLMVTMLVPYTEKIPLFTDL